MLYYKDYIGLRNLETVFKFGFILCDSSRNKCLFVTLLGMQNDTNEGFFVSYLKGN